MNDSTAQRFSRITAPFHHELTGPMLMDVDEKRLEQASRLDVAFPHAGLASTKVRRCDALDRFADQSGNTRIWLGLEHLQKTGSFKVRGALFAMEALRRRGYREVITASAGNHGAGVAFAAHLLQMKATIVVPLSTPKAKLDRLRNPWVRLIQTAGGYDEAEKQALALHRRRARSAPFLSPYASEDVALGNGASIANDLARALGPSIGHVVVPIGGGGLASGLAVGLARLSGSADGRRRVWCVQSEASPAFALSCRDGRAWEKLQPKTSTLADGLQGGISTNAFERAAALVSGVSVVSESSIRDAMRWLEQTEGLRVEGSAAVVVSLALHGLPKPVRGGDVVLLLTGRNVDNDD